MLHQLLGLRSKRNQSDFPFPHPFIITPTSLTHFDIHNLIEFAYKHYFSENRLLQIIANQIQSSLIDYFHFISSERINKEPLIVFIEKKYSRSNTFYNFFYDNPQLLLKMKPYIIKMSNLNHLVNSIDYEDIANSLYSIEIDCEELNLIKLQIEEILKKEIIDILNCKSDLMENIKDSDLFIEETEIPFKESYFENFLNLKPNNFLKNEKENILFCVKYKVYRYFINQPIDLCIENKDLSILQPLDLCIENKDLSILSLNLKKIMKKQMKKNLLEFLSEIKTNILFQKKSPGRFIKIKETKENVSTFYFFSSLFNLNLLDLPQTNTEVFKGYEISVEKELSFFLSEKSKNELLISFKFLKLIYEIRFQKKQGIIGFIEKNFWESIWSHLMSSCLKELEIFKIQILSEEKSILNLKDFIFNLIKKLFLTSSEVVNILLNLLNLSYSYLPLNDFRSLFFENILKLKAEVEFDGRNVFLWAYLDLISSYLNPGDFN